MNANRIVGFTGAGISVGMYFQILLYLPLLLIIRSIIEQYLKYSRLSLLESGIPAFRGSEENNIWNKYDPSGM